MSVILQYIIVAIIVMLSVRYVLQLFVFKQKDSSCAGCNQCGDNKPKSSPPN